MELSSAIPGILSISRNMTFGRTPNNKKHYYLCIPDDRTYQPCLVPYKINTKCFSKYFANLFILVRPNSNDSKLNDKDNNYPIMELVHVIGPVNDLVNFYEYQLYCKRLTGNLSVMSKNVQTVLKIKSVSDWVEEGIQKFRVSDHRHLDIITMDTPGTIEFDDAFYVPADGQCLHVYITNVALYFELLKLWGALDKTLDAGERVASVYLPHHKYPLLLPLLTREFLSLTKNYDRFALLIEIHPNNQVRISSTIIRVRTNYYYGDSNAPTADILRTMTNLGLTVIGTDDASIVQSAMIAASEIVARKFDDTSLIYRNFDVNVYKKTLSKTSPSAPPEVVKVFWSMSAGEGGYKTDGWAPYIHITSPIRRVVDIFNLYQLQRILGLLSPSKDIMEIYLKWRKNIDVINNAGKRIRKLQSQCQLLSAFNNNPDLLKQVYIGYICNQRLYLPELSVILPVLKKDQVERENDKIYKVGVQLYIFDYEDRFLKKVRINYLEEKQYPQDVV